MRVSVWLVAALACLALASAARPASALREDDVGALEVHTALGLDLEHAVDLQHDEAAFDAMSDEATPAESTAKTRPGFNWTESSLERADSPMPNVPYTELKRSHLPPSDWKEPETLDAQHERIDIRLGLLGPKPASPGKKRSLGFAAIGEFEKGMPMLWAVTRSGRIFSQANGVHKQAKWVKLAGPQRFSSVVQGKDGVVYALARTGEVLRRENASLEQPAGTEWKTLIGNLNSLAVADSGALWGTNGKNTVFFKAAVSGSSWRKVHDAKLRTITAAGSAVVGLDEAGSLVVRQGIDQDNPMGSTWYKDAESAAHKLARLAAGTSGQIWAVTKDGAIMYKKSLANQWVRVDAPIKFQSVAVAADGGVAAVSRAFELYRRRGVNTTAPTGSKWQRVAHSQKLHIAEVGLGATLRPLKGSRLHRGKRQTRRAGRSRTFELQFNQPKATFTDETKKEVGESLARLMKVDARRVRFVKLAESKADSKASFVHFKIRRSYKKGDKGVTSKQINTRAEKPQTPREALSALKNALRSKELVAAEKPLKNVDPTSLYRVKANGKKVRVTALAQKGRRTIPRDPNAHKMTLSRIAFSGDKSFVLDAAKKLAGEVMPLVLAKRALPADREGLRSQQWVMNMAGQVYFKDIDGDRQCIQTTRLATSDSPLSLVLCAQGRNDRQLFEWNHENGRLKHLLSGKCVTSANSSPRGQGVLTLTRCKRGGSKRQRFHFDSLTGRSKASRKGKIPLPLGPDYNATFTVNIEREFLKLPRDFRPSMVRDLARSIGISKRRVRITNATGIATANPQHDTQITVALEAAEEDSGDIYNADALKAIRAQLNDANSTLMSRESWRLVLPKTFVITSQAPAEAEATSSKIEFFLAPGNVIEGAFGGKPGDLVIAQHNRLSESQQWFFTRRNGTIFFRNSETATKWCITARPTQNATIGSHLRTRKCMEADDEALERQVFTYARSTQAFTHRASGLCVELAGRNTAAGNHIILAKCEPATNAQTWDFPATYPQNLRKALLKEQAREAKVEAAANKAFAKSRRDELAAKAAAAKAKEDEQRMLARAAAEAARALAAKQERVQFLALAKGLPRSSYDRKTQVTTYGRTRLTCRDLSDYFGIAHAKSIGFHTPSLYRAAWTAKRCSTQPLSCQELTDCYDFENMYENNAWALKNGFRPNATSDSFKYAPFLIASRYFGLFKHAKHAHGFHGAAENNNGTVREDAADHSHADHDDHAKHAHTKEHGHRRQCKGFHPLNCQEMSDYYGITRHFAGTAPKCVQAKFKVLACDTKPEQTCQILSNRFGLSAKAAPAAKAKAAKSARFLQLAQDPSAGGYIPPKEAVAAFAEKKCATAPLSCQAVSDKFQTWSGHQGKASKDTYRQFLLRECSTRPLLTCAQLSDSFMFGSHKHHPKPDHHGHSPETLGAEVFALHANLSDATERTSLMEVSARVSYNTNSLKFMPYRKIQAAYFEQWASQQCATRPHTCQQLSDVYGISPNNRGAASKAIARTFSAVKRCATHPLLSCQELSTIYGLTPLTANSSAAYLHEQWKQQKCATLVSSCQEISDSYDLPAGEWAAYAPKGVRAQFKALGCLSTPLPTCQALSDYYFINHAQIDPTSKSEVGLADRLILAKYSRWGCHHTHRGCQEISNFYGIGIDKRGRLVANSQVPQFARDIFQFRQCSTSPIKGVQRGVNPTPPV